MPDKVNRRPDTGRELLLHYAKELARRFFSDRLTRAAAELSYYLLFSIFPLSLFVSLLLSMTHFSAKTLLRIMSLLPGDVQKLLLPTLTRYLGSLEIHPHYVQIVLFSLLSIYFASRSVSSLMINVNRIYGLPETQSTLRQLLFEVSTSCGLIVAITLSIMLVFLGKGLSAFIQNLFNLPAWAMVLIYYGRSLIAVGFIFLFMLTLCFWVPNCRMRWRDALPGAVFILCAWVVSTRVFTFYFNNFNRYDAIYGSIGAIMVLLLWLYMSGIIILLGFEVNLITMKLRKRNFIYKDMWRMRRRKEKVQRRKKL